jgi:hypothetical protein
LACSEVLRGAKAVSILSDFFAIFLFGRSNFGCPPYCVKSLSHSPVHTCIHTAHSMSAAHAYTRQRCRYTRGSQSEPTAHHLALRLTLPRGRRALLAELPGAVVGRSASSRRISSALGAGYMPIEARRSCFHRVLSPLKAISKARRCRHQSEA